MEVSGVAGGVFWRQYVTSSRGPIEGKKNSEKRPSQGNSAHYSPAKGSPIAVI
jgi:hypothetical protein